MNILDNLQLSVKQVVAIGAGLLAAVGVVTSMQIQMGRMDERMKELRVDMNSARLVSADLNVRVDGVFKDQKDVTGDLAVIAERQRVMNELLNTVLGILKGNHNAQ